MHFLASNLDFKDENDTVSLNAPEVRQFLLSTDIVDDINFVEAITKVDVKKDGDSYGYTVIFNRPFIQLSVNSGTGFYMLRNGKCQHLLSVEFSEEFKVKIKKNKKGKIVAYNFNHMDIVGDFGQRGIIDIDLNYVSIGAIEFTKNTQIGRVKGKVSKKEFLVNKHSFFFKTFSRLFSGTSEQPLNW